MLCKVHLDGALYLQCLCPPSWNLKLGNDLYWELTCNGLVSHPGGVYDSHPLSTTETRDKHWPYVPNGREGFNFENVHGKSDVHEIFKTPTIAYKLKNCKWISILKIMYIDFVSFIGLFPNQETKHWRKKSQFVNMGKNIWKSYELHACLLVQKDWFVPIRTSD